MNLSIQENIAELRGILSGTIRFDRSGQKYTLIDYNGFGKTLVDLINAVTRLFKEAFATDKVETKTNLCKQKISTTLFAQMREIKEYRNDLTEIIEGLKMLQLSPALDDQINRVQALIDSENERREAVRQETFPVDQLEDVAL